MKCSYCDDTNHNILNCPYDKCIDKILDSNEEPDINSLTLKTLKRIASLRGIKVSLSKIEYILIFKKIWLAKKKEKEEEKQKLKDTIESLNRIENENHQTDCPICMEPLSKLNNCVSKCGHKFCLECLLKSYRKKNNCPICRKLLIEEDYEDMSPLINDRDDFIPFQQSQTLSQEIILNNYIHYIENRASVNNVFYMQNMSNRSI